MKIFILNPPYVKDFCRSARWAAKNNYLIAKDWTEWLNKDYEQCTLLNYPQLSSKAIDYFIDKGLKSFYLRPQQILRMILNIRSFSDIKRKLFGFKNFLDYLKGKQENYNGL